MGLADVAAGGDRLVTLRRLRDELASMLDATSSAREWASLSQRFMDVLEQIATAEKPAPPAKGTGLDEFTRRRADKAATKAPARAARGAKRSG